MSSLDESITGRLQNFMVVLLSEFSIAFVGRCKVYGQTIIDLMVITTNASELNNSM